MSDGGPNSLAVCVRERVACVRVNGMANFRLAADFRPLMEQLEKDCGEIVLDLTGCAMMDSTFQGAMLKSANRCAAARQNGGGCSLTLYHPNERIVEALANLDILKHFKVVENPPKTGSFKRVEDGATRTDINRTCFESHKELMESSEENARRFRDATDFFQKNLEEDNGKE
jgi:anti-anti-sigma regulatory factor